MIFIIFAKFMASDYQIVYQRLQIDLPLLEFTRDFKGKQVF